MKVRYLHILHRHGSIFGRINNIFRGCRGEGFGLLNRATPLSNVLDLLAHKLIRHVIPELIKAMIKYLFFEKSKLTLDFVGPFHLGNKVSLEWANIRV
jgi:hypothetical protein